MAGKAAERRYQQLAAGSAHTLAIYTNGSEIYGKVGAVAVAARLDIHA